MFEFKKLYHRIKNGHRWHSYQTGPFRPFGLRMIRPTWPKYIVEKWLQEWINGALPQNLLWVLLLTWYRFSFGSYGSCRIFYGKEIGACIYDMWVLTLSISQSWQQLIAVTQLALEPAQQLFQKRNEQTITLEWNSWERQNCPCKQWICAQSISVWHNQLGEKKLFPEWLVLPP